MSLITIRRGTRDDLFPAFRVFRASLFGVLIDLKMADRLPTPEETRERYAYYDDFISHLFETVDQFWVAEADGVMVGLARSILRDGVRQLTEFFVLQEFQSQGIGRQLLEKAFPSEGAKNRIICASSNMNAIGRYLKAGLRSRTTIHEWTCKPQLVSVETDLTLQRIEDTPQDIAILNEIDRDVIGYARAADHHWFLKDRRGDFYLRDGRVVGYSYFGNRAGPIAMLEERDFPAAIAHVESGMTQTVDDVYDEVILCIPMTNHAALGYVLGRGYKITPFFEYFLTEKPLGRLENYIFTDPIIIT
ncbi:MAG: GNAT family N-acetyltransferase [Chloroflexi bacterium]|nr:GNAT family N-acetyltransferase [Chloroflexota bacterium]